MVNFLLLTPPFTQLNTPYPATAYIKGFLDTKNYSSYQADLGIELLLHLFSKNGLQQLFGIAKQYDAPSENAVRIIQLEKQYLQTIEPVILFLQGKDNTLAYQISSGKYLPQANRFANLQEADMMHAFGNMGVQDKAKHLATLYLEDISDLLKECVDEHFGFTRYAERLGRSANSFALIEEALQTAPSHIDAVLLTLLHAKIETTQPEIICFSVPFPGNLFAAFRCAQYIKKVFPHIPVAMGGGFPNTELRSLSESLVFQYFDYITLDDGEAPLEQLYLFLQNKTTKQQLVRTFLLEKNKVVFYNDASCKKYSQAEVGTPNYTDLLLDKYVHAIEITNPMHSLWSNGRWNKLTMAHGCYWGKCTFCDVSLPYIADYEPVAAALIVDRMEKLVAQTGNTGFHFVDEAAPPALMKAVAMEIVARGITVSWWTNIRFEKSFTQDLCYLLKLSGCIGVSGGLEVASDRLLALIKKGITVAQVAVVNKHFTQAGIFVHAYLMYGFPTQSAQETMDSLEMVRQLFVNGILQSAFWHQFAMTAHSPVGLHPSNYQIKAVSNDIGTFANNDVEHTDPTGTKHELFSNGLKTSLFNYMNGVGLDWPLNKWFTHKVPSTSVAPNYIQQCLEAESLPVFQANAKVVFAGVLPSVNYFVKTKKGKEWAMATLTFQTLQKNIVLKLGQLQAEWLLLLLPEIQIEKNKKWTLQEVKAHYETHTILDDFELFWFNPPMQQLPEIGLYVV